MSTRTIRSLDDWIIYWEACLPYMKKHRHERSVKELARMALQELKMTLDVDVPSGDDLEEFERFQYEMR
jgi:hypothetical protein